MVHLCSTSRVSSANSAASASTGAIIRDDHTKANCDNGVRRLETTDLDGFEPNFVDLLKLYASMANGATVKRWAQMVACGESYSFRKKNK